MSIDGDQVNEAEVFKAIGHLEEATKTMTSEAIAEAEDEEKIVGFFTILGKVIKHFLER